MPTFWPKLERWAERVQQGRERRPYLEPWTSACLHTFPQRARCCSVDWMRGTSSPGPPPDNLQRQGGDEPYSSGRIHCCPTSQQKACPVTCQFNVNLKLLEARTASSTRLHPTWFEKEDLVILTELHEACDAFGKFHNVLYCMSDLDGALLPEHVPRLQIEQ